MYDAEQTVEKVTTRRCRHALLETTANLTSPGDGKTATQKDNNAPGDFLLYLVPCKDRGIRR